MNVASLDRNMDVESTISRAGLTYLDIDEKPFRIYGIWRDGDYYSRIPSAVCGVFDKSLTPEERASRYNKSSTAGGRVRFVTDSPYVAVNVKLDEVYQYTTMSVTATCGLDIYADGVYAGTYRTPIDLKDGWFESVVDLGVVKSREICINLPLYCNVEKMYVGVHGDCDISEAPDYKYEKPILFYGSSITHGACSSRPGMSYPAIVSRMLDANYHNLGFGGCAKGEDEVADYVASLDPSVFVYDYDYNAPNATHLRATHEKMFLKFREKHPETPVVMLTAPKVKCSGSWAERRDIIKATYDKAVSRGDRNVYIIYGTEYFGEVGMDYTADGTHPTDLGYYLMAQKIAPVVKTALESGKSGLEK